MNLILDASAFLAVERGDRDVIALAKGALMREVVPLTHGGVVAQVWSGGGPRQARLASFLRAVEIRPLNDALGRQAGVLLARSGTSDPIDAALVCLAADDDRVLSSDSDDLKSLAEAADLHVDLVPV